MKYGTKAMSSSSAVRHSRNTVASRPMSAATPTASASGIECHGSTSAWYNPMAMCRGVGLDHSMSTHEKSSAACVCSAAR